LPSRFLAEMQLEAQPRATATVSAESAKARLAGLRALLVRPGAYGPFAPGSRKNDQYRLKRVSGEVMNVIARLHRHEAVTMRTRTACHRRVAFDRPFVRQDRLAWRAFWLVVLLAAACRVWAQAPQGERHLVLQSLTVHERADLRSRIVDDVPAMRLVYARPTANPDWLQVFAASVDQHPTQRIGGMAVPVHAENGRFIVNDELPERHQFRELKGYVQRARIASLRPTEIPRPLLGERQTVPQVLARYGVKDRRFMPVDPDRYPYAAVVMLSGEDPGGKDKGFVCSGFLVAPGLVASAGHCFADGRDRFQWSVLQRRPGQAGYRQVPARLLFWSLEEAPGGPVTDSALLAVDASAFSGIQPLALASPGPWIHASALQVMRLGHAEDLSHVKIVRDSRHGRPSYGASLFVPHGDLCQLPAGQLEWARTGEALRLTWPYADCTGGPGDSGGPLLIWNEQSNRLEVLGIAAQGQPVWLKGRRAERHWTEEAQALVAQAARETAAEYGAALTDKQGVAVPHASNALIRHARMTSPWQADWAVMWTIDRRLYAEIAKAGGQADGFPPLARALGIADGQPRPAVVRWKDPAVPILSGPFEQDLRASWWRHSQQQAANAPAPAQWRGTHETPIDWATQVHPRGPARAWRLGRFLELGEHLVPDDETLQAYLQSMQQRVNELLGQRPELESSLSRYIERSSRYRVLVVGDDWFVVDGQTSEVVEVKRGWSALARAEAGAAQARPPGGPPAPAIRHR